MLPLSPLTLLLFATAVTSLTVPSSHVVHEERHTFHQSEWLKKCRVQSDFRLSVLVGLKQNNLENAEKYLKDVSDPDSPNYGKHWTDEEVVDKFKPNDDTVKTVRTWLVHSGIHNASISHTRNKGWLAFPATAAQMESLLYTQYHEFEHSATGKMALACDRYHVPAHIQQHIDYITPGVNLMPPLAKPHQTQEVEQYDRSSHDKSSLDKRELQPDEFGSTRVREPLQTDLENCDRAITPACIAALYRIPRGTLSHPNNSMGILAAGQNLWDQDDLDVFFEAFAGYIPRGTHPKDKNTEGDEAPSRLTIIGNPYMEMSLDLEIAYPIVYPQNIAIWDNGDFLCPLEGMNTGMGSIDDFIAGLDGAYCRRFRPTNVLSVSFGWSEVELTQAWQKRMCIAFMKWGLRGTSIVVASGDHGVAGTGGRCFGSRQNIFAPMWPSSCPWVTSVGGTQLHLGQSILQPETAASVAASHPGTPPYSSGGGFSNFYHTPDYQQATVSTYFTDHDPGYPSYSHSAQIELLLDDIRSQEAAIESKPGGIYNRSGRGYPDVSANGLGAATIIQGMPTSMRGMSMSAPLFASIINRINEERIAAGKSTVGFLNHVLYKHPEILNDITVGNNSGCGTPGFSTVKG